MDKDKKAKPVFNLTAHGSGDRLTDNEKRVQLLIQIILGITPGFENMRLRTELCPSDMHFGIDGYEATDLLPVFNVERAGEMVAFFTVHEDRDHGAYILTHDRTRNLQRNLNVSLYENPSEIFKRILQNLKTLTELHLDSRPSEEPEARVG